MLAAGGVGTTLLAGPAFSAHSHGVVEIIATAVAVIALLGALGAAGYMLRAKTTHDDIDVAASTKDLALHGVLRDLEAYYIWMIATLGERQNSNARAIRRLQAAFTVILCGILVELCSFAVAAAVG